MDGDECAEILSCETRIDADTVEWRFCGFIAILLSKKRRETIIL
jgi:hypothetical protein